MPVPGQENAEYRAPKSPDKQAEKLPKADRIEQSDQAVQELRGSLKGLGHEPDTTPPPPETDFDRQMQQIENRGSAIVQEASALQGELQDLTKKAEALKTEGSQNRERIETYLGDLTKNLPEGNQHADSIRNTLKNLPKYLTEADAEKIIEGARWDAAKSGLSQGDFDTMSPAEQAVVRERVKKMKLDSIPKTEKPVSQGEDMGVPSGKEAEVVPAAPHLHAVPPPKKVSPIAPESRVPPSVSPAPSVKINTPSPVSAPATVFDSHSNTVQTVEFAGWGDEKPQSSPEKPQDVVTPPEEPEVIEKPEEDAPVSVPEDTIPSERKKILGDSVPILKSFGTNKILKNRTPKGDFVAVSERGTIYIGKDIGGRDQGNGVKSITRHDIEIGLDNDGYIQTAENTKNGFTDVPPEELKKYVEYLNAMGVMCKLKQ